MVTVICAVSCIVIEVDGGRCDSAKLLVGTMYQTLVNRPPAMVPLSSLLE